MIGLLLAMHVSVGALTAEVALDTSSVTAAIERRAQSTGAPGLAVAIVRNQTLVYVRGFGVRRLGGPLVDTNTRFEIGSLTKQFTAAAVLQLKEQHKLALDDRLAKYVPAFPHADRITLRELLNQVSGLPDFMETNGFLELAQRTPGGFAQIEKLVTGPLHFAPGSQWEYSNTNYIALGRVIEVVSGERYDDYVRRHLFEPAHMQHSATISDEAATDRKSVV